MANKNIKQTVKSGYFSLEPAFKPGRTRFELPINPETSG
jgi:hypothetical protein